MYRCASILGLRFKRPAVSLDANLFVWASVSLLNLTEPNKLSPDYLNQMTAFQHVLKLSTTAEAMYRKQFCLAGELRRASDPLC